MSEPICLEARKAIGLASLDKSPTFCRYCGFGPCEKLRGKEGEAAARARVVESAAKVEKLLADIEVTLTKLRDTTDGGKGAA
jgi:hypothetical protein